MKKIIGLVATLIIFLMFSHIIYADEIVDSGTCGAEGDNITYTLDDNGTLTICGNGNMENYSYNHSPFYDNTSIKNIIIEYGVTSIGDDTFARCIGIKSITIPNSVTTIGNGAFYACSGITNIIIDNSITNIGYKAFYGCNSLSSVYITDLAAYLNINMNGEYSNPMYYADKLYLNDKRISGTVIIPDTCTQICDCAFAGCDGITSVIIPDSVKSIGSYAFQNCSDLLNVTISGSVSSIGSYAFENCSDIDSVYITDLAAYLNINMNSKYSNPMYYADKLYLNSECVAGTVTIPNTCTEVCDCAFDGCDGITSVIIPDSVKSIGNYAFKNCSVLTRVVIGDSVKSIKSEAFKGCSGLTNINIPDGITSIGDEAFFSCTGLTNITIPDSVIYIGYETFCNCIGLTNVTIGTGVTKIDQYAFNGCSALTTLNFNATKCTSAPFDNLNLMNVAIGDEVTILPSNMFRGCKSLKTIYIPKATAEIEKAAFSDCTVLTTVEYEGSQEEWREMYIGADNDYLKSANIIYNSTLFISNHTELGAAPQISVTKSDTSYTFDVMVAKPCINSYIYAVIYDIDGNIKGINRVPLELTDNTRIEVYKTENDKTAKIFVWTSNMQPITEAEEVTL